MEGHLNNTPRIHGKQIPEITRAYSKWVVDYLYLNNTIDVSKAKKDLRKVEGIGGFIPHTKS